MKNMEMTPQQTNISHLARGYVGFLRVSLGLLVDLQRGASKQVPLVMYLSADDSDAPSAG